MQRSPMEKLAEFEDRYGRPRTIIRRRGAKVLSVQNDRITVSRALTKVIGKKLGESIKAARIAAGMTMEALANKAGMVGGKARIYSIENAMDGGIRLGTLYALGKALGIDPL